MAADKKVDRIYEDQKHHIPPLCSIRIDYCLKDSILWRDLKITLSGSYLQKGG